MLWRPGTRDTAFEEWSYLPHLYSLYEEQPPGCPSLLFLREKFTHSSLQVSLSWRHIWGDSGVSTLTYTLSVYTPGHRTHKNEVAKPSSYPVTDSDPKEFSTLYYLKFGCVLYNRWKRAGRDCAWYIKFLVHKIPVYLITDGSNICSTWHLNKRVQQLLIKCWPREDTATNQPS